MVRRGAGELTWEESYGEDGAGAASSAPTGYCSGNMLSEESGSKLPHSTESRRCCDPTRYWYGEARESRLG
jgi:hypothetical protein